MSRLNDRPRLATNVETSVNEGGEVVITSAMLQVSDDAAPTQIFYCISALSSEGTLKLNGAVLGVDSLFTQADINSNLLTYSHNSSDTLLNGFRLVATESPGLINVSFG